MNIGAIVLSGGKSSRFGEDKGLFLFKGKPLIQHSLDIIKNYTSDIQIISANKEYERFGFNVIPDILSEKGPMGGIHAGLKNAKNDINIVLSSDTPFISTEFIDLLLDNYKNQEALISKTFDGKYQTLIGLYKKSIWPKIDKAIMNKHLKLISFIKTLDFTSIEIPENSHLEKCFINFNHLSELQKHEH